jgi:hypothetical protein
MTMTLSGTEWGLRAPFPFPWPPPSRSRRRATPGAAPSPAGGAKRVLRRLSERPAAQRSQGAVPVRCYSISALRGWTERAAVPAVAMEQRVDGVVLRFRIPGAKAHNTEVVWDAQERRLAVGVWVGDRPRPDRRSPWPPEFGWYRAQWLPYCDGRLAVARARHGVVEVVVPWLDPDPGAASRRGPPPTLRLESAS